MAKTEIRFRRGVHVSLISCGGAWSVAGGAFEVASGRASLLGLAAASAPRAHVGVSRCSKSLPSISTHSLYTVRYTLIDMTGHTHATTGVRTRGRMTYGIRA